MYIGIAHTQREDSGLGPHREGGDVKWNWSGCLCCGICGNVCLIRKYGSPGKGTLGQYRGSIQEFWYKAIHSVLKVAGNGEAEEGDFQSFHAAWSS